MAQRTWFITGVSSGSSSPLPRTFHPEPDHFRTQGAGPQGEAIAMAETF
jgi:hypothetical protein